MGTMKNLLGRARDSAANATVVDLRRRVAALEAEVQENRALNVRIAELTDLVTELLVPLATRDEAALRATLEKYHESV